MNTRLLFVLLALAGVIGAQPSLSMSATSVGYPGSIVPINIILTGSGGAQIGWLQFLAPASTAASFTTAPPGAASVAVNKALFTASAQGSAMTQVYIEPVGLPNLPYGDGVVASFAYQIPATAVLGTPVTVTLSNAVGITTSFNTIPLGYPTITFTAGIDPACMAKMQTSIGIYQSDPVKLAMLAFFRRLTEAYTTGTCQ